MSRMSRIVKLMMVKPMFAISPAATSCTLEARHRGSGKYLDGHRAENRAQVTFSVVLAMFLISSTPLLRNCSAAVAMECRRL